MEVVKNSRLYFHFSFASRNSDLSSPYGSPPEPNRKSQGHFFLIIKMSPFRALMRRDPLERSKELTPRRDLIEALPHEIRTASSWSA